MAKRTVFDTQSFIIKATEKHGSKFNYSQVKYVRSDEKVTIVCDIHGVFEQTPNNHLKTLNGCTQCCKRSGTPEEKVKRENKQYRAKALKCYGEVCNRCGYKEHSKILQVHHKDHDRENNIVGNLEVLCPNCHMTEHYVTYKSTLDKPVNEDVKIE